MIKKEIIIKSETGLDAMPAGKFVKVTSKYKSNITIEKNGKKSSGKTLLGILGLGICCGDVIMLTTDGSDEQEMIDDLVKLNNSKFE